MKIIVLSRFEDLLVSICKSMRDGGVMAEIIVADDGLPAELDLTPFAPITRIPCPRPFIYARNLNIALRTCPEDDVFLINDDARLVDWKGVERMAETASKPGVGIVSAGYFLFSNVYDTVWTSRVSFNCAYLRRSLLNELGDVDERFAGYGYEDTDYSLRAHVAGYKNMVVGAAVLDAKVPHTQSFKRVLGAEGYEKARNDNSELFMTKWGFDDLDDLLPGEPQHMQIVEKRTVLWGARYTNVENIILCDPYSDDATQAVELFLRSVPIKGPLAAQRARLCIQMAYAYLRKTHMYLHFSDVAERWALRALQGSFRIDALVILAEIAWRRCDFESAIRWYEAANQIRPVRGQASASFANEREERMLMLKREIVERVHPVRYHDADDSKHALIVMTAPRKLPFLDQTLKSLQAAGLERWKGPKYICADGYSPDARLGWRYKVCAEQRGQAKSFFAALKTASEIPELAYVTLFEDDIVLSRNALDYIKRVEIGDNILLVSWYSRYSSPTQLLEKPKMLKIPSNRFAGFPGITMPNSTVRALLASDTVRDWTELHGADHSIMRAFTSGFCRVHFPNIVQHMGIAETTTASKHSEENISPTFAGEDFDAMSLLGGTP